VLIALHSLFVKNNAQQAVSLKMVFKSVFRIVEQDFMEIL